MAYCEICGYEGSKDNPVVRDWDRLVHEWCLENEDE
jgi:hypothetical protein